MMTVDDTRDVQSRSGTGGTDHCSPRCPRFVDRHGVGWLVRPFEPSDRESVLEMYHDFAPDQRAQGLPPIDETRLENWVDDLIDEGCNFVASRGEHIVGHAVYTPTDAAEPELAVFVHQDYQGRGLGTELCRHVVETAEASDRDGLVLEVTLSNKRAINIYERLGFERVDQSTETLGRRSHAIHMRLPFPSSITDEPQYPPALTG